MRVFDVRSAVI